MKVFYFSIWKILNLLIFKEIFIIFIIFIFKTELIINYQTYTWKRLFKQLVRDLFVYYACSTWYRHVRAYRSRDRFEYRLYQIMEN